MQPRRLSTCRTLKSTLPAYPCWLVSSKARDEVTKTDRIKTWWVMKNILEKVAFVRNGIEQRWKRFSVIELERTSMLNEFQCYSTSVPSVFISFWGPRVGVFCKRRSIRAICRCRIINGTVKENIEINVSVGVVFSFLSLRPCRWYVVWGDRLLCHL